MFSSVLIFTTYLEPAKIQSLQNGNPKLEFTQLQ